MKRMILWIKSQANFDLCPELGLSRLRRSTSATGMAAPPTPSFVPPLLLSIGLLRQPEIDLTLEAVHPIDRHAHQ